MLRSNPPKAGSRHQPGAEAELGSAGSSPTFLPSICPSARQQSWQGSTGKDTASSVKCFQIPMLETKNTYNKSLLGLFPGAPSKAAKLMLGRGLKSRKQIQHYARHI